MPKITVEFKRPDRISAVIIHFECSDGRLKYYTGETGRPGSTPPRVSKIVSMVEETAADYRIASKPLTKAVLKQKLDKMFRPSKAKPADLFSAFDLVIEKMQDGRITTPGKKRYAPGSIKSLRHTIRLLRSFNPNLTQESVGMDSYYTFIHFCQNKNYSTNYIGGQIRNWKTLGKAVGGNPIYDNELFKKISEETFDIYLDEKELKAMYELKLNARQDLTRDWFILDCYTGLRVSDLTRLSKINLSKGFINISNEKTDEQVIIPIHPYVKAILSKYKGVPPKLSDQELNRTIKHVAKKVIKGTVLFQITKGGKRVDEYLKKWEMVSNHCARRSFITNLLKRGASETLVMKLTGIKSSATLKRYNRMSIQEAASIMREHEFFK